MVYSRIEEYLKAKSIEPKAAPGEPVIAVSDAVSALSFYYEKIRNVMEYADDHLLRQMAIRRILGRRSLFGQDPSAIAGPLVRELVRSRYVPNNILPQSLIKDVERILSYYFAVLNGLRKGRLLTGKRQEWLLHMASCAIDELLAPMTHEEALARVMVDVLMSTLDKSLPSVEERVKKGQLLIACYRILLRPNIHRLEYFLLKQSFGALLALSPADAHAHAHEFVGVIEKIDAAISYSLNGRLQRVFRRFRIPFIVLHNIVKRSGADALSDPDVLDLQVRTLCEKMYTMQRKRLVGRTIRAFIYIFLTKMVLGFSVEIPYDLLTAKHVKMQPLILNILVPPAVLAFISFTVRMPGKDNTEAIVQAVREIVFKDTKEKIFVPQKITFKKRGMGLSIVFNILYAILSAISVGLFTWVLIKLDFNIVSGVILFFFLSLVMFFGITLRRMINDLVIIKRRERFLWLFIAQFFDPIMRLGQWLSFRIARINVLVFIFDMLIELPFQAFVDITEEWFAFMKEKKEDLEQR